MRSINGIIRRFIETASEERKDSIADIIDREFEKETGLIRDAQLFALKLEEEMIEDYLDQDEEIPDFLEDL